MKSKRGGFGKCQNVPIEYNFLTISQTQSFITIMIEEDEAEHMNINTHVQNKMRAE